MVRVPHETRECPGRGTAGALNSVPQRSTTSLRLLTRDECNDALNSLRIAYVTNRHLDDYISADWLVDLGTRLAFGPLTNRAAGRAAAELACLIAESETLMDDVRDYLLDQADHVSAFRDMAEALGPPAAAIEPDAAPVRRVDLTPWLDGSFTPPEPTVGAQRDDLARMLYPGRWHTCVGLTAAGKSWLALAHARAELEAGRTVVYLHFEEDLPGGTVSRLLAIGVPPAVIRERFVWLSCDRMWQAGELAAELAPVLGSAGFEGIGIVVLDGQNAACTRHGQDPNLPIAVGWYRDRFVGPAARTGAAVLSLGHPPKAKDRQDERHGFGSTAWLDEVDGVGFRLVGSKDHPILRGASGSASLYVVKDRYGSVARIGSPDSGREGWTYVGSLVVDDSGVSEHTSIRLASPTDRPAEAASGSHDDEHVLDIVCGLADQGITPTLRGVRAESKLRNAATADALERLVNAGKLIESTGSRGARLFSPSDIAVTGSHLKVGEPGTGQAATVPGTSGNRSEPVETSPGGSADDSPGQDGRGSIPSHPGAPR